jgi:hypothetical protein
MYQVLIEEILQHSRHGEKIFSEYLKKRFKKKVAIKIQRTFFPMLRTEDTGKELEMAICMAYGIQYVGKYKYGYEEPSRLSERLKKLPPMKNIYHSAINKSAYDFMSDDGNLSAKSTKKSGGKVAPQRIGQCSIEKFCERINISPLGKDDLKRYIQNNIVSILPIFESNTFESSIVYYIKQKDEIRYIQQIKPIDWTNLQFSWTRDSNEWTNSSTLKVKDISIMEIQFHTKRKNMACRWCFENLLSLFSDHFSVVFL